jgi:mechanosensitive ion channel protein 1/2/3
MNIYATALNLSRLQIFYQQTKSYLILLGVATAYGAKDILANITSGLSLQFLQPFSVGDSIQVTLSYTQFIVGVAEFPKNNLLCLLYLSCLHGFFLQAGSIEGEVTEIGLTTTSLINSEELPVVVPNSVFLSEVNYMTLISLDDWS